MPLTDPLASKGGVLLLGTVLIVNVPESVWSELTVYLPSMMATPVFITSFPLGETKVGTVSVWNRNYD